MICGTVDTKHPGQEFWSPLSFEKYERNVRRNDSSSKTITWSKHSLRIEPIRRSTYARCHGRPRSAQNFIDIHYSDLITELLPVDSITISQ